MIDLFKENKKIIFGVAAFIVILVGVFFGAELVAEGSGQSKQEAEQKAAQAGIRARNWKN